MFPILTVTVCTEPLSLLLTLPLHNSAHDVIWLGELFVLKVLTLNALTTYGGLSVAPVGFSPNSNTKLIRLLLFDEVL